MVGCGLMEAAVFNYNTYNIKIIRDDSNKETKLLFPERLAFSTLAFTLGAVKSPIILFNLFNYCNILMIGEKPENYYTINKPEKKIEYYQLYKYI